MSGEKSPTRPADPNHPECLSVLGLLPPVTEEDVKQAYLAKAMAAHPDRGGDPAAFIRLQKAYEDAKEFVKFKAGKLEWLASKVEIYSQQQDVAAETIERGGEIEMEEADWLRKSFGEDFGHVADKLVRITLHGPKADDTFAVLVGFRADSLKDLHTLDLAGGSLTDTGLLQLKGLKGLRRLDLRGTAVGKLGTEVPGWFEHLEFLGLPKGAVGMFARLAMPRRLKLELGDAPRP
ncbi:MAG: J domain-containing protein [Planctomycetia bacterium]|nr:J domain-containing protein [Planctomycetia bacterium]